MNLIKNKLPRIEDSTARPSGDVRSIVIDGELSERYETEELDSVGFESDDGDKHKFVRFRIKESDKDFKFTNGKDFCSIKEFKEVILEHSLLNGKQVTFKLNDLTRARAKCIGKCGFEIFCSKVGRNTTYKITTCKPKYNYGKDFKNKNATSKWVSKVAVESLCVCVCVMSVCICHEGVCVCVS